MNGEATMNMRWAKRVDRFLDIGQAKEQGFQIVQLPVAEIMRLDDRAFRDVKIDLLESGLSFEVFEGGHGWLG